MGLHFQKDERYLEFLKIGSGNLDILREGSQSFSDSLIQTVKRLNVKDIEPFLEHQTQDNPHPKIFFLFLKHYILDYRRIDTDKKKIVINWITNKIGFTKNYQERIAELLQNYRVYDSSQLIDFINGKSQAEVVKFLKYGRDLLIEQLDLHKKFCMEEFKCEPEKNFEKSIESIDDILSQVLQQKSESPQSFNRIQWKGNQKQLGELFIELKNKGWIEEFDYTTIKNCFTNSNTIQQVLKPTQDKKTKIALYDGVYSKRYVPVFSEIEENPKK